MHDTEGGTHHALDATTAEVRAAADVNASYHDTVPCPGREGEGGDTFMSLAALAAGLDPACGRSPSRAVLPDDTVPYEAMDEATALTLVDGLS